MNQTKQKSMIRPVGIVAFALITALLVLCFYWAAPWLIKQGIERTGTQINGARVDVANVDLSLSPAGIYIFGLQVTDAKQPMQNMLELEQAYAELNLFELWGGKIIIEDLNIQSLRFGTERTESGAVSDSSLANDKASGEESDAAPPSVSESFASLGGELPDAESILERHPLKTTSLATQLDATFAEQKNKWQATAQALPDETRLEYYEQEFKKLTSGDIDSLEAFNARKTKFDALKRELEKDQALLLQAKKDLQQSQDLVQKNYQALKRAPQEDFKALKAQYSLDADGGLNLTGLLFGSQFQSYVEDAMYWYNRLAPLMANTDGSSEDVTAEAHQDLIAPERGTGRFIHFGAKAKTPDFLIQKAQASAVLSQGELMLLGQDITHQQYLTGKPSVVSAKATELNDTDALDILLTIDHRTEQATDTLAIDIKGQSLEDLNLSQSENLAVSVAAAKLDLNADVLLENQNLSGSVGSRFNSATLVGDGESQVAKELASALANVEGFYLNSQLSGTLSRPEFAFESDLDKVLKDAIAGRFKEKQKEWEGKLKAKLDSKLSNYLAENKEVTNYFGDQSALLDGELDSVASLLDTQLDSYVDAQADEAKDKASNALKDKLKGLF
ncbi:hypothetical protein A3742_07940 [Oleiphilus sp. HI0071]|uniref:TIGR03545 family protein n=3 Tax=Oleiphilus TaxID=141450 RepID=UPI0007C28CB7|nr:MULTISPECIES: TIGR03545 family protein [unclassified Oleiphilus]KZY82806.1 hypothetical protein A3742_07940 [Oleiphilus sp. HI0071]KZZ04883.1 hypothetical protein A3744_09430 [Oleiphilus sp. HI0073]KZZ43813.1 hypothetical protein A3758_04320 [Oleiphilus sp. HI0118]KZZ56652.1 hypothetical protein A3760_08400 [Oleiphilus sp. HI0122]KZZ72283.1 hypothetical protein A3765_13235 [Oleiphilus sp. HI0130]KZZ80873.1 hypothetical protein A3767_09065 [Oleiphilus sp. HI0133]